MTARDHGLAEDDAAIAVPGSHSESAWKKSWKIQKAELAEMMTRRSLSWKLSKALERSGASDPRVTVALLNIWPKSAVDEETAAPRAPAIAFPLPCLAPAHSATLGSPRGNKCLEKEKVLAI